MKGGAPEVEGREVREFIHKVLKEKEPCLLCYWAWYAIHLHLWYYNSIAFIQRNFDLLRTEWHVV